MYKASDGAWYLYRQAIPREIVGSAETDSLFDRRSGAIWLNKTEVIRWFEDQGFELPPGLVHGDGDGLQAKLSGAESPPTGRALISSGNGGGPLVILDIVAQLRALSATTAASDLTSLPEVGGALIAKAVECGAFAGSEYALLRARFTRQRTTAPDDWLWGTFDEAITILVPEVQAMQCGILEKCRLACGPIADAIEAQVQTRRSDDALEQPAVPNPPPEDDAEKAAGSPGDGAGVERAGLRMQQLMQKTQLSDETLRQALVGAGVRLHGQGQHSRPYLPNQILAAANWRKEHGAKDDELQRWTCLLEGMGSPPLGSKPKAKPKRNPNP